MKIDISKFSQCKMLVIGDLMLDEYIWGEAERISPEAPVQVVSVNRETHTLGGAGNVVNNLVCLGARVSVAGVVGTDAAGKRLLDIFHSLGTDTQGVFMESDRPTTRKARIIAASQQVLRIDWETRKEISSDTFTALCRYLEAQIPETDLVLISDYAKGLITRGLLSHIVALAQRFQKVVVADPKGLDFSKYAGVSLLTPNKKEASLASGIEIIDNATLLEAADRIRRIAQLQHLLVTCGKEGMVLYSADAPPCKIPAQTRQVFDVSGAGDTVLAVLGLSLAAGYGFEQSARLANTAAGIVVGKVGTATVSPGELEAAMASGTDVLALKYRPVSELAALVPELKKSGKRIVLTNGCFDLLHAGHIRLFSRSKQQGDVLIVAIDDDASVSRIKGPGRPVIGDRERVKILSALDSVDYVTVFSSDALFALLETLRPDVLTKGSNYNEQEVVGRSLVEKFGGRVALIPITEKVSSSEIIDSIRNHNQRSRT